MIWWDNLLLPWLNFDKILIQSKLDNRLTFDMQVLTHQYYSRHFIDISYNLIRYDFLSSVII